MAENTKIEWTDHTFNPWEGCQKVGPGCDHCYAETRNARFGGGVAVNWGPGAPRRRTSAANWRQPLLWNARAAVAAAGWDYGVNLYGSEAAALEAGHVKPQRPRVFCASLADVFDNAVDPAWRAELFALIRSTPDLDWLLLTKRIGNAHEMIGEALINLGTRTGGAGPTSLLPSWPWANVWIGATVVNQQEFDRDLPKLNAVPAAVRFLSVEPLLGPIVDRDGWLWGTSGKNGVDWVIVGGESGPGARPMHPEWARSLRDQCAAAGVPFLFKQWGEWTPGENVERQRGTVDTAFLHDDEPVDWRIFPLNLATDGGHIDDQPDLYRVGKKAAGRLLDGVEHNGFPA